MSNKIVVNSNRGDRMLIEDENGEKTWYFLSDKVKNFCKSYGAGDLINFQHSIVAGKKTINFIEKVGQSTVSKEEPKIPSKGTETNRMPDPRQTANTKIEKDKQNYSDERVDSIVRQTVAKCASTALTSLAGQVDENTINETWNKLYDNIYQKITTK